MKRISLFIFALFTFMFFVETGPVRAVSGLPADVVDAVDLSDLKAFINTVDEDVQRYLPRLDLKSWDIAGPEWDLDKIGKGILKFFFREIFFNYKLIGELILLAMALAILENIKHAFEEDNISRLAFGLCFLVVMGMTLFLLLLYTERTCMWLAARTVVAGGMR